MVTDLLDEVNDEFSKALVPLSRQKSKSAIHDALTRALAICSEDFAKLGNISDVQELDGLADGKHAELLTGTPLTPWVDANIAVIEEAAQLVFRADFGPAEMKLVRNYVVEALTKHKKTTIYTGLVFAGFGNDEKFPSLHHIVIDGVYADRLRCLEVQHYAVNQSSDRGQVLAFAQPEVTNRFLYGIDDDLERKVANHFADEITDLKAKIVATLNVRGKRLKALTQALEQGADEIVARYFESDGESERLRDKFFAGTLEMVRLMPKQEMADLAEALVNITIIKGKASHGQETVGGPIDVAVISRHEGFVWVKRKHYFDPKYNARYFWRHFGRPDAAPGSDAAAPSVRTAGDSSDDTRQASATRGFVVY